MAPKGILEGIKVADFSWVAVGPVVGREFADHGATVVRIESHKRPDLLRVMAPYKAASPG
jgi:benzylsuccinate CoA-transferase BbsF subunit